MEVIFEEIEEQYPDVLLADGFNEALIGMATRCGSPTVAVYDEDKVIELLEKQGMSSCEAREYFDFNISGAYVGERIDLSY